MEKTINLKRSDLWEEIYQIVKQIPRKDITDDAPDAPSVATDLEELFYRNLIKQIPNLLCDNCKNSVSYKLKVGECIICNNNLNI